MDQKPFMPPPPPPFLRKENVLKEKRDAEMTTSESVELETTKNENLADGVQEPQSEQNFSLQAELTEEDLPYVEALPQEKTADKTEISKNPLSKKEFIKSKAVKEKSNFDWVNFVNWAGLFLSLVLIALFVFLLLGR